MPPGVLVTRLVILAVTVGLVAYDVAAAIAWGRQGTISIVLRDLFESHPWLVFVAGSLAWHILSDKRP